MIPLVVVAGFLGSGKTTFLRRLAPELVRRGVAPTIVLNDVQNARIDAATLEGLAALVAPIEGSCVCCGSREEFLELLREVRVEEGGVLLVEANGTMDSGEMLELLAVDRRAGRFGPPVQVGMVDVKRWQRRGWNNGLERDQLRVSSYLAFSREDQVEAERMCRVRSEVRAINGSALVVDGEVLAEILERRVRSGRPFPARKGKEVEGQGHEAFHRFSAVQIPLREWLEEPMVVSWVSSLPEQVLRVKGAAKFGSEGSGWRVFQWTGAGEAVEFLNLRRAPEVGSVAVVIGAGLDEQAILAGAFAAGIQG